MRAPRAPPRCRSYGKDLPLEEQGFNAGVFVFNLRRWAAMNLTAEVEHWIRANNRERLYMLGSQPPLTISIFGTYGPCERIPTEWHVDCLGCIGAGRLKAPEVLEGAKLLHWNGPNKPFGAGPKGRKPHRERFAPFEGRAECNRRLG